MESCIRSSLVPEGVRWSYIPGYDDDYVICDNGMVISAKRNLVMRQTVDKKGYCYVNLCKGGKYTRIGVHRLVAAAFCRQTSDEFICVNHKDENKCNNNADNLEWCSYQYNNNYGTARERAAKTRARPVVCVHRSGEKLVFDSCTVAAKAMGISQGNIWGAANGLWKTAGGYEWRYIDGSERKG